MVTLAMGGKVIFMLPCIFDFKMTSPPRLGNAIAEVVLPPFTAQHVKLVPLEWIEMGRKVGTPPENTENARLSLRVEFYAEPEGTTHSTHRGYPKISQLPSILTENLYKSLIVGPDSGSALRISGSDSTAVEM